MRISRASLALMIILAAWFGLNFIGIKSLVQREPLVSLAGLMLLVLAVLVSLAAARVRGTALLAAIALAIWAALQIEAHWSSYLLGATQKKLDWYDRVFGANWHLLPSWPGHTVPDAYHTVLFAALLTSLMSLLRDAIRRK